jgi:hypothetical protein
VTVPQRPDTRQHIELQAIAQIAAQAAHQWTAYLATAAAMTTPTLKAAAGGDGGRSSEHPDRTYAIVASMEHFDETCDAIHAWLIQGRWIQDRMRHTLRENPDYAQARAAWIRENECSGAVDPACRADREPGRTLCSKCRKRRQRERQNVPATDLRILDFVPTQGVETASVEQSAHTDTDHGGSSTRTHTTLPAQTATAWCHHCRQDFNVPTGTNPGEWLTHHQAQAH